MLLNHDGEELNADDFLDPMDVVDVDSDQEDYIDDEELNAGDFLDPMDVGDFDSDEEEDEEPEDVRPITNVDTRILSTEAVNKMNNPCARFPRFQSPDKGATTTPSTFSPSLDKCVRWRPCSGKV